MPQSSAAKTLRDSFGDRKLPDISRKITSCVLCRKLKIKCHMAESKPPCTRCKARGLSCTVNKSLQMLLENDASWKEKIEERIKTIEESIMHNSSQISDIPSMTLDVDGPRPSASEQALEVTRAETRLETSDKITLNLSCSLGAFPASSMMSLAGADEAVNPAYRPDLISCGVISLEAADNYLAFYKTHLDPEVHCVLTENDTLADVRARSSLLTAAICTVASFCSGSEDYQRCFSAFTDAVSRKLFSTTYEFDDVRALCIGAFWLNDVCSVLNGLAVRIGTQLDLHRCISKMPHTKKACYDRTRLYFLVYLCDHHCSLVYGRPPMTDEWRSLKSPGAFLQSEFSNRVDLTLICQVELWSISRRVFARFGADLESNLANEKSVDLQRLSQAYDQWQQDWLGVLDMKDQPSHLSRRVFDLYFHSAKLYLYSHVFRGPLQTQPPAASNGAENLAQCAFERAVSIVRSVVDGFEAHWLEKLPLYFGTMIAFASIWLIRTLQDPQSDGGRRNENLTYLHRLAEVLRASSVANSPTHPLSSIAKSLETATAGQFRLPYGQIGDFNDPMIPDPPFNFDPFNFDPVNSNFIGLEDSWMDWMHCPEDMNENCLTL